MLFSKHRKRLQSRWVNGKEAGDDQHRKNDDIGYQSQPSQETSCGTHRGRWRRCYTSQESSEKTQCRECVCFNSWHCKSSISLDVNACEEANSYCCNKQSCVYHHTCEEDTGYSEQDTHK